MVFLRKVRADKEVPAWHTVPYRPTFSPEHNVTGYYFSRQVAAEEEYLTKAATFLAWKLVKSSVSHDGFCIRRCISLMYAACQQTSQRGPRYNPAHSEDVGDGSECIR